MTFKNSARTHSPVAMTEASALKLKRLSERPSSRDNSRWIKLKSRRSIPLKVEIYGSRLVLDVPRPFYCVGDDIEQKIRRVAFNRSRSSGRGKSR